MAASKMKIFLLVVLALTSGITLPFGDGLAFSAVLFAFIFLVRVVSGLVTHKQELLLYTMLALGLVVGFKNGTLSSLSYIINIFLALSGLFYLTKDIRISSILSLSKYVILANGIAFILQQLGVNLEIESLSKLSFIFVEKGNTEVFNGIARFSGLYPEPTHAAYVLLPLTLVRKNDFYKYIGIFLLIATFSIIVYIILLIYFLIMIKRIYIPAIVLLSYGFFLIVSQIDFVQNRVLDAQEYVTTFETRNPSILAITSNAAIALKSLESNFVFGSGLTGHRSAYDKYILEVSPWLAKNEWKGLNRNDASSLYILILSEFGLLGIIVMFSYIFKRSESIASQKFKLFFLFNGLRFGGISSFYLLFPLIVALSMNRNPSYGVSESLRV